MRLVLLERRYTYITQIDMIKLWRNVMDKYDVDLFINLYLYLYNLVPIR